MAQSVPGEVDKPAELWRAIMIIGLECLPPCLSRRWHCPLPPPPPLPPLPFLPPVLTRSTTGLRSPSPPPLPHASFLTISSVPSSPPALPFRRSWVPARVSGPHDPSFSSGERWREKEYRASLLPALAHYILLYSHTPLSCVRAPAHSRVSGHIFLSFATHVVGTIMGPLSRPLQHLPHINRTSFYWEIWLDDLCVCFIFP